MNAEIISKEKSIYVLCTDVYSQCYWYLHEENLQI